MNGVNGNGWNSMRFLAHTVHHDMMVAATGSIFKPLILEFLSLRSPHSLKTIEKKPCFITVSL